MNADTICTATFDPTPTSSTTTTTSTTTTSTTLAPCRGTGQLCASNSQCCSGQCLGPAGVKVCR
jgi:hypothetical protein